MSTYSHTIGVSQYILKPDQVWMPELSIMHNYK